MAIDMATLKATTFGDQDTKLTVKRSWLAEVYRLLNEGDQAKREVEQLKYQLVTLQKELNEPMPDGAVWDDTFGDGGMFDKVFGKKRRRG